MKIIQGYIHINYFTEKNSTTFPPGYAHWQVLVHVKHSLFGASQGGVSQLMSIP
jgi:hypothetical protein